MRLAALALAVLLPAAGGCGSVLPAAKGGAERDDEVAKLRERVLDLQRQSRINEVEIARLRRQVAELEAEARGEADAPERRPAMTRPPTEPLPDDGLEAPVSGARPRSEDLEMPSPAPPPSSPSTPSPDSAPPSVEATPLSAEGQALYDRGYTLYHQAAYVDSETAFQGFLRDHPRTDLADNAQFWIGESRLRRGDTSGALAAFRETVERFPRGNKVPDAMFRIGDCLERLGDLDGARSAWRSTIERFPSSAAAALSEERLDAVP